ncbi:MAG: nitrogen fixation protein NifM [Chromatiales bacterium]|jgi:peptidyl-prolyl cis-trans isomerase C
MTMASAALPPSAQETEADNFRYHLLRAALDAGKRGLAGLSETDLRQIEPKARRSHALESLVLSSPEAAKILVPQSRVDEAVGAVRGRYDDERAFQSDLAANGLDARQLRSALQRELIFDGVMQRVAARRPAVTELDERLFFELHKERFTLPERRIARHILITINDDFAENGRDAAHRRIQAVAEKLGGRATGFARLARRHSECPTAMEDGRLGAIRRGQLYPALDAALFALEADAISAPVESDLGFHILWCEQIQPAQTVPFGRAREQIRQLLDERGARACQRQWIAALQRGSVHAE